MKKFQKQVIEEKGKQVAHEVFEDNRHILLDIEIGQIVETLKAKYPISWGEVIYISADKKFFTVMKKYGTKILTNHWAKKDLKLLPKYDKFHLTSKKNNKY